MNQTWKNDKNLILGPILAQICLPKFYSWVLFLPVVSIVSSCHLMQFKGKLMNQTWENGKKTNLGPDFSRSLGPQNVATKIFSQKIWYTKVFSLVLPLLDVRNCCKLSLYAISWKTNESNLIKWLKKPSFRPILATLAQICAPKVFSMDFISTRC